MMRKLILATAFAFAFGPCLPAAGEGECAAPGFVYLTPGDLAEGEEGKTMGRVDEADLRGRKFVLAKVDGEAFAVAMGEQPFLAFGDGLLVTGSACNSFRGPGELVNGVLTVANAASTRRMCIDPNLAGFERYFHRMLQSGVVLTLEGATLTLAGGGRTLEYVEEK